MDIPKTRYTVKVDTVLQDEVEAYSPESAAYHAMEQLDTPTASVVNTITGGGQRIWFYDVSLGDLGRLLYSRKVS